MATEQEIMARVARVASRDFPQWFGSPWKLRGRGSKELDGLLDTAKAAREPIDLDACRRLDEEMKQYEKE
jgi:hypothetical protein